MKAHVEINLNSPQAMWLLGYLESLPFAKVQKEDERDFEQAAKECNAVSVKEFFDQVRGRINQQYDKLDA